MSLEENKTQALLQALDPKLVQTRQAQGGRTVDYVEGHVIIDQANRIFGFGEWGYEITTPITFHDTPEGLRLVLTTVRVTVAGCPSREDVGVAVVRPSQQGDYYADSYETAIKGAVTGAMKRAMRTFGSQFGNSLHAKTPYQQGQQQPGPNNPQAAGGTQQLQYKLIAIGRKLGMSPEQVRQNILNHEGKPIDHLPADVLETIIREWEAQVSR